MSENILDLLEGKVKEAVETIQLLQLEIDELKAKYNAREQEYQALSQSHEQLKTEHNGWQDRLRTLVGQMDDI